MIPAPRLLESIFSVKGISLQPSAFLSSRGVFSLPATDRYFCDITREIAEEYPALEFEQFIVDDMAHRLVLQPHELDVMLLPNL